MPFVICQVTIINQDIHRVKFQKVSTLTQNVFKDCLPVRAPYLTSSFILQRRSSTEVGTWVTCNKAGSRIKDTSPSEVPRKISTKSITQLLKVNTPGGRSGGTFWQSDQSTSHLLTSHIGSTRVCVGWSWSNANVSVISRGWHGYRNPIVPRTVVNTERGYSTSSGSQIEKG